MVVSVNIDPLSTAPEEGITLRFQLWKTIQRASVGTLAWLSHEAISGRDRKQTSRFFGSRRIRGMDSSVVTPEITQGPGNRAGPGL